MTIKPTVQPEPGAYGFASKPADRLEVWLHWYEGLEPIIDRFKVPDSQKTKKISNARAWVSLGEHSLVAPSRTVKLTAIGHQTKTRFRVDLVMITDDLDSESKKFRYMSYPEKVHFGKVLAAYLEKQTSLKVDPINPVLFDDG